MVEYKQQIDYSMPRQNGLFPPPPYKYPRMRAIVILFQCTPGIKKKYLPNELESVDQGIDVIFISEYPDSTIGPYNENLILLGCKYKRKLGSFVFNIYVDSDEALTAGREIWGYPKKMCDISLSPIKDNKIRGNLTRKRIKFLDIEVELTDEPLNIDPKTMMESMPLYNLKLIPDVENNSIPVLRQLTETKMKYEKFYKTVRVKTNYIKSTYSKYDICDEILKDAKKDLGGIYVECDQILPNGRALK
jgi:acetoacetate decarboxylase